MCAQELTFEELCFMMHRLFRDRLSNKVENLMLKYTDAGTWLCVCPRAPARTATNRPAQTATWSP
jgi:hypothetical protein